MKAFIIGSAFAVLFVAGAAMAAPEAAKEAMKACCEAMAKCCCCDDADKAASPQAHDNH